ncbi:MAG: hypothetical protein LBH58_10960 [Tannerellaceae bacterium]|jgi:hypothetical protein|nr:hypothetical protein [Tannerellaceae bacterium]
MSILLSPQVSDYSTVEKSIYSKYQFNCKKIWKGKDTFIIYEGNTTGISKIYESSSTDLNERIEVVVDLVKCKVTNRLLISGGHTVVDLSNRLNIGKEAIESTTLSLELIKKIQHELNIHAEFLIQLNDIYMEYDAESTNGTIPNKFREQALKPYIIPCEINSILKKYSDELDRELNLHYCSSKNLADQFKRHIKNEKRNNQDLFKYVEDQHVNK